MTQIILGVQAVLNKEFVDGSMDGYTGIVRADSDDIDFSQIVKDGARKTFREGWRHGPYFVKKLGKDELDSFPPKRFINSLDITEVCQNALVPHARALIYEGRMPAILSQEAPVYMVSDFVEGPVLNKHWQNLSPSNLRNMMTFLGSQLEKLRSRGLYLMDFAPRDIVIEGNVPRVVDTEHAQRSSYMEKFASVLLEQQREQFREDYSSFLDNEALTEVESRIFR